MKLWEMIARNSLHGVGVAMIAVAASTSSGHASDSKAIDPRPLFKKFDGSSRPAAAFVIVQNGQLVSSGAFGMANMETQTQATMASVFEVGSLSKMFTAYLIEHLVEEGKISEKDDIRKFLADFPDYGKPIKISDLLRHTSGLRDYFELMSMRGLRLDDSIIQDDVLKLAYRQKDLNFEPGSESAYSNTEYALLAEVVKRVSGEPFSNYAEETIFKPLGMASAHFIDDRTTLVPHRAQSYIEVQPGHFITLVQNSDVVGPSGLWMSANDLEKWLRFIESDSFQKSKALAAMRKPAQLPDGRTTNWGAGFRLDRHSGYAELYHDGGDEGYRSVLDYFPERQLAIAIVANAPEQDLGDLAEAAADLFLGQKAPARKPAPVPEAKSKPTIQGNVNDISGIYRSGELDTEYQVSTKDGKLVLSHVRNPTIVLSATGPESWSGDIWWLKTVDVVRNKDGHVTALKFSGFRGTRNLMFVRTK